jgi:hypothetical protein
VGYANEKPRQSFCQRVGRDQQTSTARAGDGWEARARNRPSNTGAGQPTSHCVVSSQPDQAGQSYLACPSSFARPPGEKTMGPPCLHLRKG